MTYLGNLATRGGSTDADWRHRARCRDVDPELFFPVGTTSGQYKSQIEAAKAVCALCPVRDPCLAWALDTNQDAGVWGEKDEVERRQIRRGRRQPLAQDRHGTVACYDANRCRCSSCRKAKAAANRRKRIRSAS